MEDDDELERALDGLTREQRAARKEERDECGARQNYPTLRVAQDIALNVKRLGGPEFTAYQCRFCRGYHIKMRRISA